MIHQSIARLGCLVLVLALPAIVAAAETEISEAEEEYCRLVLAEEESSYSDDPSASPHAQSAPMTPAPAAVMSDTTEADEPAGSATEDDEAPEYSAASEDEEKVPESAESEAAEPETPRARDERSSLIQLRCEMILDEDGARRELASPELSTLPGLQVSLTSAWQETGSDEPVLEANFMLEHRGDGWSADGEAMVRGAGGSVLARGTWQSEGGWDEAITYQLTMRGGTVVYSLSCRARA